jgi:site-specific DNA recombinase
VPEAEWITIPVPALVDEGLFAAAQEQLRENRRRARIPLKGSRYLLQGLLVCACCGYAYYGRTNDARNAYYRCSASDAYRCGGTRLCSNRELRMDCLDQAVWGEVARLLQEPERLEQEYRQRLQPPEVTGEVGTLEAQLSKLRRGGARLIDGYTDGLIEKEDFEARMTHLRARIEHLEGQAQQLRDLEHEERELRLLVGRFDRFAQQVREGLDQAEWTSRREIIRAVVKRVEIDREQMRVVFRVSPSPPSAPPDADRAPLQHHEGRVPGPAPAGAGARHLRAGDRARQDCPTGPLVLPPAGALSKIC